MIFRRRQNLLSILAAFLLLVSTADAFPATSFPCKKAVVPTSNADKPPPKSSVLFMVGMSPTNPDDSDQHKNPAVVFLGAVVLAMLVATANPLPLHEGFWMYTNNHAPTPVLESSSHIISGQLHVEDHVPGV